MSQARPERGPHLPRIESPTNPGIAAAAGLRDRKRRLESGLTIVDGVRELGRAATAGVPIDAVFICREHAGAQAVALADRLGAAGTPVQDVSPRAFARLAYGDRDEGVVAVVRPASTALADLSLPADPLIVVTEDVEKPGNLGAVLRSADGAGADAVIASGGADLHHPNVIRASTGIVFGLAVAAAPAPVVLAWLRDRRIRIVTARVDAKPAPWQVDLTGPLAVVLGSEAHGLGETWTGSDLESVRLPMLGVADSLNVAVTAAVLLYEARRQRGIPGRER